MRDPDGNWVIETWAVALLLVVILTVDCVIGMSGR